MPDAVTDQPTLIPLVLPPAQWSNPADAFKLHPLSVPITVDGREHKAIGIRRFTVAQMRAVSENFRVNIEANPDARPTMPIYVDEAGQDLPLAVLDAMTPDDFDALDEATIAFLPRRMRPTATDSSDASPPAAGSSTEQ